MLTLNNSIKVIVINEIPFCGGIIRERFLNKEEGGN
jgi:hypothetical protein